MDADLEGLSREQLIAETKRLRNGIRKHRDSTGHQLCWHIRRCGRCCRSNRIRFLSFRLGPNSFAAASDTASRRRAGPSIS